MLLIARNPSLLLDLGTRWVAETLDKLRSVMNTSLHWLGIWMILLHRGFWAWTFKHRTHRGSPIFFLPLSHYVGGVGGWQVLGTGWSDSKPRPFLAWEAAATWYRPAGGPVQPGVQCTGEPAARGTGCRGGVGWQHVEERSEQKSRILSNAQTSGRRLNPDCNLIQRERPGWLWASRICFWRMTFLNGGRNSGHSLGLVWSGLANGGRVIFLWGL